MRKIIVLLADIVLGLSSSLSVGVHTVNAQYISTDVQVTAGSTTTLVNQPVEFTAKCSGGTPPYTYQWYTQLWPTWKPGMSYHLSPLGSETAVPGATSSKFTFGESTPGTYSITLLVTNSEGQSTYACFLPGLWVFVQLLPAPSPSPSPLNISFLSPENKTYATANGISLNFTISKLAEWTSYCVDGQANITINKNMTLTTLSNGVHTLMIYANDTEKNIVASQTVYFSIEVPQREKEPLPTTLIGAIVSVMAMCIGLIVVFRKWSHK
jgi:hypothetical protein